MKQPTLSILTAVVFLAPLSTLAQKIQRKSSISDSSNSISVDYLQPQINHNAYGIPLMPSAMPNDEAIGLNLLDRSFLLQRYWRSLLKEQYHSSIRAICVFCQSPVHLAERRATVGQSDVYHKKNQSQIIKTFRTYFARFVLDLRQISSPSAKLGYKMSQITSVIIDACKLLNA